MIFIKSLFAILIVIPVAVLMFFLARKLIAEYNAAVKKTREMANDREVEAQAEFQKAYRRENPRYDAYRRRMEQQNEMGSMTSETDGTVQRASDGSIQPVLREKKQPSKRKRRKERKRRKAEQEYETGPGKD